MCSTFEFSPSCAAPKPRPSLKNGAFETNELLCDPPRDPLLPRDPRLEPYILAAIADPTPAPAPVGVVANGDDDPDKGDLVSKLIDRLRCDLFMS